MAERQPKSPRTVCSEVDNGSARGRRRLQRRWIWIQFTPGIADRLNAG
jgi:hypothetical protein